MEIPEKEKVYIETSFISALTARPSENVRDLARQMDSQSWWNDYRHYFDLWISDTVLFEIEKGDPEAAKRRLELVQDLPVLEITDETKQLVGQLIAPDMLPEKATEDALHIAVCATNGIDYLLTWNCKHLANAITRRLVYHRLEELGFVPPEICTPIELMEK